MNNEIGSLKVIWSKDGHDEKVVFDSRVVSLIAGYDETGKVFSVDAVKAGSEPA